jgi:hypothetical protein
MSLGTSGDTDFKLRFKGSRAFSWHCSNFGVWEFRQITWLVSLWTFRHLLNLSTYNYNLNLNKALRAVSLSPEFRAHASRRNPRGALTL